MKKKELNFEDKFQIIKANIKDLKKSGEQNSQNAEIISRFQSFKELEESQKIENLQSQNRMDYKYWVNILHGICETGKFEGPTINTTCESNKSKPDTAYPDTAITNAKQIEAWYNAPDQHHR